MSHFPSRPICSNVAPSRLFTAFTGWNAPSPGFVSLPIARIRIRRTGEIETTLLNTRTSHAATKTVTESQVEITQLMRPQQGNFAGNVHGGVLLSLMDEAAYLCASRYSGAYCVTVAVDHVEFHSPVRVGDRLTLRAAVNSVGKSSMQVGISVIAEDPRSPDSERRTTRSFFTMIALDDDGSPLMVPRLKCETTEDCKWKCEAELRQSLRREFTQRLADGSCQFEET